MLIRKNTKIFRAYNPFISLALVPWYVANDQTPFQIGMELNDRMREEPENTFVLIAMNGEKAEAILIAYIETDHVHVWQARKKSGFRYSGDMFAMLCQWAQDNDISILQCAPAGHAQRRLYRRKYGFESIDNKYMRKRL